MNKENVLFTGSDGMLGSYFDFGIRMSRAELDITNLSAVIAACQEHKPDTIVHLAALTDLTVCEREPSRAYAVNAVGAYHMALAARTIGAKLVYISTSGVFDGIKKEPYTEGDVPNPVNTYGHSKYLCELAVAGMLTDYLIVRASWLFGGGKGKDKKFVGKLLGQLRGAGIRAVADKRGSPTYAKDLARAVQDLLEEDARGVIHLGEGSATRYDMAKEVVAITGAPVSVEPMASEDFPSAYRSGPNESMPMSARMRPWQEALREYLTTEWGTLE